MQRVLLLLKRSRALDACFKRQLQASIAALQSVAGHLQDRDTVHEATVKECKDVLDKKGFSWKLLFWDELQDAIRDVDLVVTVGGDGTVLHASHFLGSSIPILGVNSDPTRSNELEGYLEEFDATRSTGYLCAATKDSFEQVLGEVVEERRQPLRVRRMATRVNGSLLKTYALNDVLLAHPNPGAVTRCTFRICERLTSNPVSPWVHMRSSGLRLCTGIGSTAAMQSAGGYTMARKSTELQYMVREPITPLPQHKSFMHRRIQEDEMLHVKYTGRQGNAYFDGPYIYHSVGFGDVIQFSTDAPQLQIFLNESHV